jgi:hypothetical protein
VRLFAPVLASETFAFHGLYSTLRGSAFGCAASPLVRSEVATTSGAPGNSSGRCNAVFVERTILGYSGYIVGRSERVSKMAFRKARLFRIP